MASNLKKADHDSGPPPDLPPKQGFRKQSPYLRKPPMPLPDSSPPPDLPPKQGFRKQSPDLRDFSPPPDLPPRKFGKPPPLPIKPTDPMYHASPVHNDIYPRNINEQLMSNYMEVAVKSPIDNIPSLTEQLIPPFQQIESPPVKNKRRNALKLKILDKEPPIELPPAEPLITPPYISPIDTNLRYRSIMLSLEKKRIFKNQEFDNLQYIQGEKLEINAGDVISITSFYTYYGYIYLTNYRIYFLYSTQESTKKEEFILPYGFINTINKTKYQVEIICKNFRNITFKSNLKNNPVFDRLTELAFPLNYKKKPFAFSFNPEFRWLHEPVYDAMREIDRQGLTRYFYLSNINKTYTFCESYPSILILPQQINEESLKAIRNHRSEGRIPVISWVNPRTKICLLRSSQPKVSILRNVCKQDDEYLQTIAEIAPKRPAKIIIYDARSKVEAKEMQSKRGGYEDIKRCTFVTLEFLNIPNNHIIKNSFANLRNLVNNKDTINDDYICDIEWTGHINLIFSGVMKIVQSVEGEHNVLVHCGNGWDRTPLLVSLAMFLLDPYYRTIIGFQVLIEKEWICFGHKFAQRIGTGYDYHMEDQKFPIFVLFIDCIWQLMRQASYYIEFNETMLKIILEHLYSGLFGTFLCNTESEFKKVETQTVSLWTYINFNQKLFENPNYAMLRHPFLEFDNFKLDNCSLWNSYYRRWVSQKNWFFE